MEAHKAKMSALSQELETLQSQLQALGPQKLRGSTASLTTSSVAEDVVENISGSSETEENPNQHQEVRTEEVDEENKAKELDPEKTHGDEENKSEPEEITDELTT